MLQRLLILECDQLLTPDDPGLGEREASIQLEIRQSLTPPILTGGASQLDAIRKAYISNLIALQLEGLPVDSNTPALLFWQYIDAIEAKYKAKTARSDAVEPL